MTVTSPLRRTINLLNHSFMRPGLVAVISATTIALLLSAVYPG